MTVKKGKSVKKNKVRAGKKTKVDIQEQEKIKKIKVEIKLLVMLTVSIVLLIGVLGGGKGPLIFIGGFLFGLFGVLGYIFPVALFVLYSFILANEDNSSAKFKLIGIIFLFLSVNSLIHLLSVDMEQPYHLGNIYLTAIKTKAGGGVVGSILAGVLYNFFGKIASVFILFAAVIISLILLTQRSFLGGIKKGSGKLYHTTVNGFQRRKEEFEKRHGTLVSEEEMVKAAKVFEIGNRFDLKKTQSYHQDPEIQEFHLREGREGSSRNVDKGMREIDLFSQTEEKDVTESKLVKPVDDVLAVDNLTTERQVDIEEFDKIKERDKTTDFQVQAEEEKKETLTLEVSEKEQKDDVRDIETVEFATMQQPEETTGIEGIVEDIPSESIEVESPADYSFEFQKEEKVTETEEKTAFITETNDDKVRGEEGGTVGTKHEYALPSLDLLKKGKNALHSLDYTEQIKKKLADTFKSFNIDVTMSGVSVGPTVTRYELSPAPGVKVSKIQGLADDIKLALAAPDIRIEAPIPGKSAVGVEVPNKENSTVMLRSLLEDEAFQKSKCKIPFAVGKDLSNKTIVEDIAKMPHLLIAGATGSGKSVCINTLIMSILYKASPKDVRLIMIDPKVVELSVYNGIPHLLTPIVTDPRKAAGALNWAVAEMSKRYKLFAEAGVRDLSGYNEWIREVSNKEFIEEHQLSELPQIVIIVDELADLMMVSAKEAEEAICRLAQLARAAGMHLIIATQRPSVNVITGLIKANMPSRIAFSVTSGVDSRTILDMNGAEKLLGKGDMLFGPQWLQKPVRLQGAFVSDKEVDAVTKYLKEQAELLQTEDTDESVDEEINQAMNKSLLNSPESETLNEDLDPLFHDAASLVVDKEKASIGMLQRALKIGFNRAGRIMDQMEAEGIVGSDEGTKPRTVLMDSQSYESYKNR